MKFQFKIQPFQREATESVHKILPRLGDFVQKGQGEAHLLYRIAVKEHMFRTYVLNAGHICFFYALIAFNSRIVQPILSNHLPHLYP